jgi:hypothetical protein
LSSCNTLWGEQACDFGRLAGDLFSIHQFGYNATGSLIELLQQRSRDPIGMDAQDERIASYFRDIGFLGGNFHNGTPKQLTGVAGLDGDAQFILEQPCWQYTGIRRAATF